MKLYLILFVFALPSFAQQTFKVSIKGEERTLEDLKKKAELKMVSSTKHCRGSHIPSPVTQWECSGTNCNRTYECKFINKNFSRKTEVSKLKSKLKKKGEILGTIEIPGAKPLVLDQPKPVVKKVQLKLPDKKEAIAATPTSKVDKFEEEALALLDEEDFAPKENMVPEKISKMDRDITYEELVEPKKEPVSFAKKEAEWKLVKTTSREGGLKSYELEKIVDKTKRFEKKLKPLAAAFGLLNSTGTDTDVSSFYAAWVPRWEFNWNWALRGEIGIQYFAQTFYDLENVVVVENNFTVSPYALYLNYFGDFYFIEAGGGVQWWYDQEDPFNPMVALGVGYRIPDTFFALDRISLNLDYVFSDPGLTEIKLSFTFLLSRYIL